MNYEETIAYMYDKLPMFQRIGAAAYKADLGKTLKLMNLLGQPQQHLRFLHVAGTNGKGSVCHLLDSILQCKGLKTGLFTSPHLNDFRERIRIDGKMIAKSRVAQFVSYFKKDFEKISPSFFEMTFAMGLRFFKESNVDLVVLETGMGGRLDSTNVVHPLISVITNISMDHKEFLGTSLEMIAAEKAGIIKPGVPVVVGKKQKSISDIFAYKAELENTQIIYAEDKYKAENVDIVGTVKPKLIMDVYRNDHPYIKGLRCPMIGYYQKENIITTIQVIDELIRMGYDIRKNHIVKGVNDVIKTTGIRGRYQILQHEPLVICDTAHNAEALRSVLKQLTSERFNKMHFILGVVNDKDIKKILKLLPSEAIYYFCKADIPRGKDAEELMAEAVSGGLKGETYPTVQAAYKEAIKRADPDDLVYVGGSTFTVAEVL